jgi:hypothetical protein
MNYAVVILAFVFVVALVYWFIRGKYFYTGPRTRAHVVNGMVIEDQLAKIQDQEQAQQSELAHKTVE